jgi:quercetin dioxygenase-like cupin family protein
MTRRSVRQIVLAAAFGMLMVSAGGATLAREAMERSEPITTTVLAQGAPVDAPGKSLQLERYTLAEGAAMPEQSRPGPFVVYVQQGQFAFAVVEGEATVTKAGSPRSQIIEAGSEVIAYPGDEIFVNGGVVHTARNASSTTVVVLTAALMPASGPGF